MGLFRWLVSKISVSAKPVQASAVQHSESFGEITVTITGPRDPVVNVSDSEIAERASAYAFVLTIDPPELKTVNQWWNEETHKRRRRERSERAFAWLQPFVPREIAKLEQFQAALELGPHGAAAIAKELRALIRERRKAKVPHQELLLALYGSCVASDFYASLKFEGIQPHYMARFVDIDEVQLVKIDYKMMGYQCIDSLSKTDVKWMVEAFGEPAEHQSIEALWPSIRRNAVARYCWGQLRSNHNTSESLGLPKQSMQEWLNALVKRNIGYYKEWQERTALRQAYLDELSTVTATAWAATRQPFIVADLETSGIDCEQHEVLEFAAVQAEPSGVISKTFSVLVRGRVPAEITRLTGITQTAIDAEGRPLSEAMKAFIDFVGTRAVFFHNAPFDMGFIRKAAGLTKVKFASPVHDLLPLARQAWPSLSTYKLSALAVHVGVSAPTHRALSDATTALGVLLAARKKVESKT